MTRPKIVAVGLVAFAAVSFVVTFRAAQAQEPAWLPVKPASTAQTPPVTTGPLSVPTLPTLDPITPAIPKVELPVLPAPQPFAIPLQQTSPELNLNKARVETAPLPRTVKSTGDTPLPSIKQTLLGAAMGATLAASPTPAFAQDNPPNEKAPAPVVIDKTAQIKAELEELKKQMKELQATQKQISDAILGRNEGKRPEDAGLHQRLDTMVVAMKKLDDKMSKIGDQITACQRTALSSPLSTGETRGTIRLVNDYHVDVSMIVNGKSYNLKPSQTLDVAVPAGEFGYALPQSGGVQSQSKIKDGETVTLRIK